MPPRVTVDLEHREWDGNLRVHTELLSLPILLHLGNYDPARLGDEYRGVHEVPEGWNVTGHFLEQCGMTSQAAKAWRSYVGCFTNGAIFAVHRSRLSAIPKRCLPKMRALACGHHIHGFIFERMWLHLFGLPFLFTEQDKVNNLQSLPAIPLA